MSNGEGIKGRDEVLAAARARIEAQRQARLRSESPDQSSSQSSNSNDTPVAATDAPDVSGTQSNETAIAASPLEPDQDSGIPGEKAVATTSEEAKSGIPSAKKSFTPSNPGSIRSRALAGLKGALANYTRMTSTDNTGTTSHPLAQRRPNTEPLPSLRNMTREKPEGVEPIDNNEELEHKKRKQILWKMLGDLSQESLNGTVHAAELIESMKKIREILASGDRKSIDALYLKITQTP